MKNVLYINNNIEEFDSFSRKKFIYSTNESTNISNIYEEIASFINANLIDTLVCDSKYITIASRLLWQSSLKQYILRDTDNPFLIEKSNDRVQKKMWDIIASKADKNPIEQTGWVSSFTGKFFSAEEMGEWVENTKSKLNPYLSKSVNVVEIGVASGLTCCAIAPFVNEYVGIDISTTTLTKTKEALNEKNITNVVLIEADAMQIDNLGIEKKDIVIINSVAQYFPGYNYFILLLKKLVNCMNSKGIIFLGDLLDWNKRENFIHEVQKQGGKYNKNDLYYSHQFIEELPAYIPEIDSVIISEKEGKIENELKKYRYDAILKIDKIHKRKKGHTKFQYAMLADDFCIDKVN